MPPVRVEGGKVSCKPPDGEPRAAGECRDSQANKHRRLTNRTYAQRANQGAGTSVGAAHQTLRRTARDGQGGALTGGRARQWEKRRTKSPSARKEQQRDSQSKAEAKARAKKPKSKKKNQKLAVAESLQPSVWDCTERMHKSHLWCSNAVYIKNIKTNRKAFKAKAFGIYTPMYFCGAN